MDNILTNIYYDPNHPSSFGSIAALREATNNNYSVKAIKNWLSAQNAYTLHRYRRLRFMRERYYVTNINDLFQADLIDFRNIAKYNKKYNYILLAIDVFSKKVWTVPLKTKNATEVINAFKNIFTKAKPLKLQSDHGTEFLSSKVQAFFKTHNVQFYATNNPDIKACIAERAIRTIKEKLFKYFTHENSYHYLNVLQQIVDSYNNRKHSSIGMAPNDVNDKNLLVVWDNLYGGKGRYNKIKFTPRQKALYNVGDHVRISREKFKFEKGYTQNWSTEIFVVTQVYRRQPRVYALKDLNAQDIRGRFYEQELQGVSLLLPEC